MGGLVDFDFLCFGVAQAIYGDEAVLTLCGGQPPLPISAIDETAGKVINSNGDGRNRFASEVQTIEPVACVMASTLSSIDLADLRGATLLLNGKTWTVRNHLIEQSSNGPGTGEILLLLTEME